MADPAACLISSELAFAFDMLSVFAIVLMVGFNFRIIAILKTGNKKVITSRVFLSGRNFEYVIWLILIGVLLLGAMALIHLIEDYVFTGYVIFPHDIGDGLKFSGFLFLLLGSILFEKIIVGRPKK